MQVNDKHYKKICTSGWRKKFYKRIVSIPGLIDLLADPKKILSPASMGRNAMAEASLSLVKAYSRINLAWARSHYNNAHLINYWRWYNKLLVKWIKEGSIQADFPVFRIVNESGNVWGEGYQQSFFDTEAESLISVQDARLVIHRFGGSKEKAALLKSIIAIRHMVSKNFVDLYYLYVGKHKQKMGLIWESYIIHRFLDAFLYVDVNGNASTSGFEGIFFSSSAFETLVFLDYMERNKIVTTTDTVAGFLKRQRKYYAKRAVANSLEENEVFNYCKDTMKYDVHLGLVIPNAAPTKVLELSKEKIEAFNRVKLQGCPFARSTGVKSNAMVEVFEYFDGIIVRYLERDERFSEVFVKTLHSIL